MENRITKKTDTKEGTTIGMPKAVKAYWKLKDHEDIEDELGISIKDYFRLFNTAQLWVYSNCGKWKVSLTGINTYSKTITLWNGTCRIEYPFSGQGRDWAFEEDELK